MELKFVDVIGFRTEDPKFPAANLLRGGKWLSERKSRSSVNDATLHLGKVNVISAIDIGNCGSAFVSVEVSRVGLQRFETLLPSTEFMSARDGQMKNNWTCVQMFSEEHFVSGVRKQKWDLVRVVCVQPFLQHEQFGLTFFKVFSAPERTSPPSKRESPPPPWSVFAKMRDCSRMKVESVPTNRSEQLLRAAMGSQSTVKPGHSPHGTIDKNAVSQNSLQNSPPCRIGLVHRTGSLQATVVKPCQMGTGITKTNRSDVLKLSNSNDNFINGPLSSVANHQSASTPAASQPSDLSNRSLSVSTFSVSTKGSESCKQSAALSSPHHPESQTANVHRRKKRASRASRMTSAQDSAHNKKHCQHSNQQCKQRVTPGKTPTSEVLVMSDSDSDATTVAYSDGEASTLLLPLPSGEKGQHDSGTELSPFRVLRDFDSDTETVIAPVHTQTAALSEETVPESLEQSHLQGDGPSGSVARRQWVPALNRESSENDVVLVPSSPENSPGPVEVLMLDSDGEADPEPQPGPSRVSCPLCSELFEISLIEEHAAMCGVPEVVVEPEPKICKMCPICSRYFPVVVLPQHADLCAERLMKLDDCGASSSS